VCASGASDNVQVVQVTMCACKQAGVQVSSA
jgi:hypothetical protein